MNLGIPENIVDLLEERDTYFRELTKKVIMGLISEINKPKKMSLVQKVETTKIESMYSIFHLISSFIYPQTIATQKRLYDELKNKPKETLKQQLEKASLILDSLTYIDRVHYLEDIINEDFTIVNNIWEYSTIKWRAVKEQQ